MQIEGRDQPRSPAQSHSADVAALSQRAQRLWTQMFSTCDSHLQDRIQNVLEATCDELFRLADQSFNNADQQSMLESKREIQRLSARVTPRMLSSLGQPSTGTGAAVGADDSADAFNALELVDPQQFEESVLLDDITARLNSRSSMPLFELGYRVAALQASPVLNADELPFGPGTIVQAFRDATAELDLPSRDRKLLFRLFEQHVGPAMRTMYEDINAQLVQERILPNLQAGMSRRTDANAADAATTPDPEPDDNESGASPAGNDDAGQPHLRRDPQVASADAAMQSESRHADDADYTAAFNMLSELLAKQRETLGVPRQPTAARVPEPRVLEALKDLQIRTPPVRIVDGRPAPRSMRELREHLMQQLSDGDSETPPQLSPRQRDSIDVVGRLFDHIGTQLQPGGTTPSLLTRLQVPMLRVAMTDQTFFSQHEHPARRFLNSLIETANQWLDQGEPDPALSKRLRALTHRVANEYDGDNALFDEVRRDIDEYVDTLAHRARIAEKRHVEAARGRERLEVARSRARQLIDQRIADGSAPELVNTLLEQAWTDVLSLTILRSGERSDAFRRRMRVTDQLLRFTAHNASDEERTELRTEIASGLGQVGIHGDEATHLVTRVAPDTSTQNDTSGDAPDDDELTRRLRQRQAVTRKTPEPVSRSPGVEPLNKDEQAALDRILQLPFGCTLLVKQPNGHQLRQRLAWYSPRTGRCLMLNQRGSRCDETLINDLARGVTAGRIFLPGDKQDTLLDRAWKNILDTLKQFAGQSPDHATTQGAH